MGLCYQTPQKCYETPGSTHLPKRIPYYPTHFMAFMRTIIVDDEVLARRRVLNLLKKLETIEVVAECNTGQDAITAINSLQPDLVFLDINIRDMDGFQVLENIKVENKPFIIFVTAHDDFALKAFDFEAFDYLVKPFKEDRFYKTVNRVVAQHSPKPAPNFEADLKRFMAGFQEQNSDYLQKIAVKQGNKTQLVATDRINYILASGVYAELHTDQGMYLHRESMNQLAEQLDPKKFFRVHRSAIVNLGSVKEIVHSDFSEIDVRMEDQKLISVSKSLKKEFLAKLGI